MHGVFIKKVQENKIKTNQIIALADWRKNLGHSLIKSGQIRDSGWRRPSISVETKLLSIRPNNSVQLY